MRRCAAADIPLPTIRQPRFALDRGRARHWHGGDPYLTHSFDALSMMFPIGEQSFIDSVRPFLPDLTGKPHLRAQALAFIGQEGAHRCIHADYNEQLAALGYRNRLERWLRLRVAAARWLPRLDRLAITVAFEHYTAVLGAAALANPAWLRGADPEVAKLWQWHAVEETEHKAVAFDIYRACGGGELRRALWFLPATLLLTLDTLVQVAAMLARDGALLRASTWRSAWRFWFGEAGAARHLLRHALAYLRPGFHPWQTDNRSDVDRWLRTHRSLFEPREVVE